MTDTDLKARARGLAAALEPFAGQVYFSPECHENYAKLGFRPSAGQFGGVAAPDGPAYFCSRGSVMGQVPGEVIASAFAVFNPAGVIPGVDFGWSITDAATICAARDAGAIDQLTRVLGAHPDGIDQANALLARAVEPLHPAGRPLYAGLRSLGLPGSAVGDAWRRADMLREFRGDAHTAAWTSAGFDATEIGMLSEPYMGLPLRSYVRSRGWSEAELDGAEVRLTDRGLLEGGALTDRGREEREAVEVATDRQCRPFIDALGDDAGELISILAPWGSAIRAAKGYLASGPHDLASAFA